MRHARVILIAVVLTIPATLFAQAPPSMPMHQAMNPDCQAMMQKMQAMQQQMKAMDDRLDKLVADMNAARGSKRVDRMAAVINELVTQRKQMEASMQTMMPAMMQHMQQHMQAAMKAMMDSMSCPMMQQATAQH